MKEKSKNLKSILNVLAIALVVLLYILANQTTALAVQPPVAAGGYHTVGVKSDGTVAKTGSCIYGECDVSSWTDIVQVAAGSNHTVGLKSDGTVVAVGSCIYGKCDVSSWTDIVQVAAGRDHTVGLKSDGTVVAVGSNYYDQLNVGSWTDIAQVAAGGYHTLGVTYDYSVAAAGWNGYGSLNVYSWTDIVQVATGYYHTVGVKSDGTVVVVGRNTYGQLNVGSWTDIVQVAAGWHHTLGLKSDGTVVAVGRNNHDQLNVGSWADIVHVAAGHWHTLGVKSNSRVVAVGNNSYNQCNVAGWEVVLFAVFEDVPPVHWAFDYIIAIYDEGITTGCSKNPLMYCPKRDVTRDQMAAFLVRAVEGEPPANYCDTGSPFSDVSPSDNFCKYIKRLSELGITQGCGGGKYCPKTTVKRDQMAAFLVRAVVGEPPANYCATGSPFSDVSPAAVFCKYIKRLSELEITKGCGGGNYCPKRTVKRDQMAVFLGRAFLGMD